MIFKSKLLRIEAERVRISRAKLDEVIVAIKYGTFRTLKRGG